MKVKIKIRNKLEGQIFFLGIKKKKNLTKGQKKTKRIRIKL